MSFYSPHYFFPSQYVGAASGASAGNFSSPVAASASSGDGAGGGESMDVQIKQQIKFLRSQYNETLMELDRCKQEQEAFSVTYHTFMENKNKIEQMAKQVIIIFSFLYNVHITIVSLFLSWERKTPTWCRIKKNWIR